MFPIRARRRLNVNRCAKELTRCGQRVGKSWPRLLGTGMLQGSDLPFSANNAAVGFWLCLPTYLPRLIARLVQVSPTRKGFVSPRVSVSDSTISRSRYVNSWRTDRPLVLPFPWRLQGFQLFAPSNTRSRGKNFEMRDTFGLISNVQRVTRRIMHHALFGK